MTNVFNFYTKLEYKGKRFNFPNILISLISFFKRDENKNLDNLILITGEVGSGKSNLAKGIAGVKSLMDKTDLTIDNFTWSAKGVSDFVDREDNEEGVIVYDEAIKGGTGRDVLTKEGNALKVSLVVGRRKRHFYIMIVDELQEFNRKIISRAKLLIDVRMLMIKGEPTRGYFKLYNKNELNSVYWLLKEKKIKSISEFNGRIKPFYTFDNYENVFIDENEYENKKIEETKQDAEQGEDRKKEKIKLLSYGDWVKGIKAEDNIGVVNGIYAVKTMKNFYTDWKKISLTSSPQHI